MSFSFPTNHLTLLAVIYVYYCYSIIILSNHLSVCIIINIIVLQYHSYDIIIFDKNMCYTYLMGNLIIMHYVIVWLARPNFSLSRGNERLRSSTPG